MKMNTYLGTIFYRPTKDGIDKIRVSRYISETAVECKTILSDNPMKFSITIKRLLEEWAMLEPDGFINFSIVMVNNAYDVIATMSLANDNQPWVVLRQNINNLFEEYWQPQRRDGVISSGISVSQQTIPAGMEMFEFLAADKLIRNQCVSIYNNDKIDDFISCLKTKPYDRCLEDIFNIKVSSIDIKFIRDTVSKQRIYAGCCRTLKELLIDQNFMYDVHKAFAMVVLDNIHIEDNLYVSDNIINGINFHVVVPELQKLIEKQCSKKLYNLLITNYTKDIDLDEIGILGSDYILLADSNDEIYLCTYDREEDIIVDDSISTPEERLKNIMK